MCVTAELKLESDGLRADYADFVNKEMVYVLGIGRVRTRESGCGWS